MVQERLQAHQRGELSAEDLRGDCAAMFSAGAIALAEGRTFLAGGGNFP